jgi:hypothetical protein
MSLTVLFADLYGVIGLIESFLAKISNFRVVIRKIDKLLVAECLYTHVVKCFTVMFYAEDYEAISC